MRQIQQIWNSKYWSLVPRSTIHFLKTAMLMSVLVQSGCTSASDTFEVTREVLLKDGLEPSAIVRAPDGGYIVTGTGHRAGVAIKTNAQGSVVWSYNLPDEGDPKLNNVEAPMFTGAMPLRNGNTLLCGYTNRARTKHRMDGLLIKLDSNGMMLEKQDIYPNHDDNYPSNYISRCVPWGNGFVMLGTAGSRHGDATYQGYYWAVALDTIGNIKWEKLVPIDPLDSGVVMRPMFLLNGDLVLALWKQRSHSTVMVRLNEQGEIKAQEEYQNTFAPVLSIKSEPLVRILSCGSGTKSGLLLTLGPDLKELARLSNSTKCSERGAVYHLADDSTAIFDTHGEHNMFTANIVKWNADNTEHQEFIFKPQFDSGQVDDAVPTETLNEFATVRKVIPGAKNDRVDVSGMGIGLAFIRIK